MRKIISVLVFALFPLLALAQDQTQTQIQLEQALAELNAALSTLEESEQMRAEAANVILSVREELSELATANDAAVQTPLEAALQEENRTLQTRLGSLQSGFDTAQSERTALQEEVGTLRQRLSQAQTQLAQAQGQLEAQRQQQIELSSRNEQLRQDLEGVRAQNGELNARLESVQGNATALRDQLAAIIGAPETQTPEQEQEDSRQGERESNQAQTAEQPQVSQELAQAQAQAAERAAAYLAVRQQTPNLSQVDDARRNEVETLQQDLLAAQRTVARLSNAQTTYTVENGDFLSDIAAQFYDDGSRWTDIVDANSYLEDPDTLVPGMVLVIPPN